MLTLHTKVDSLDADGADVVVDVDGELVLAYDQREKCRLRARLVSGEEVAVFTVRGTVLRDGDLLTGGAAAGKGAEPGPDPDAGRQRVIRIVAANEPTYVVHCANPLMLARCAFHLGNRHTQAQIGETWLRIRVDPVLREMVEGLGARVEQQDAPFEPEAGAYAGGGHGHGHGHGDTLLAPVPLRQKIHRPSDPVPP